MEETSDEMWPLAARRGYRHGRKAYSRDSARSPTSDPILFPRKSIWECNGTATQADKSALLPKVYHCRPRCAGNAAPYIAGARNTIKLRKVSRDSRSCNSGGDVLVEFRVLRCSGPETRMRDSEDKEAISTDAPQE